LADRAAAPAWRGGSRSSVLRSLRLGAGCG
jgi:hypothetical protein